MDSGDLVEKVEALHPESYAWALACCGWDREEAIEVLQTTYVKVLDGRARFDGRSALRTWLFSVIRHTAFERRRRRVVRGFLERSWRNGHVPRAPLSTPETRFAESETSRRLRDALKRLSRRQREVLLLVFYQETTVEEASRVLKISLGSARTHYERGKERLRRLLAEERP